MVTHIPLTHWLLSHLHTLDLSLDYSCPSFSAQLSKPFILLKETRQQSVTIYTNLYFGPILIATKAFEEQEHMDTRPQTLIFWFGGRTFLWHLVLYLTVMEIPSPSWSSFISATFLMGPTPWVFFNMSGSCNYKNTFSAVDAVKCRVHWGMDGSCSQSLYVKDVIFLFYDVAQRRIKHEQTNTND